MLLDLAALLAAVVLAAAGGEAFLRGVLGLAAWWRLPTMLVATTLAAFATSSPELTVTTLAALEGQPAIGLGDALGSNVTNIALILGLALLFGDVPAAWGPLRRDGLLVLAVPLLTGWLALDGELSRLDGALLLGLFAGWLVLVARQASRHRQSQPISDAAVPAMPPARFWSWLLVGLVGLLLAGRLFVSGASGLAAALGMPGYVIGVTLVALGTSLPELVTTLLSRWRGEDDVGLGTLLGSNLFNGLVIVGTAAVIHPIRIPFATLSGVLGVGVLSVLLMLPFRGRIPRGRGVLLLLVYLAHIAASLSN
ncbi:calcium/sodium antiporter [uncultured Sphaerotilus sp.]|uniref:calcium/sodium antiporter n=1 Tax=uncultured Sphaerotilus sp. TaxID=474984 RepID=UPI0030CA45DD